MDEINRATPRTQSSLLEAIGEGQVTMDGGTHSLPEAQLDRFFLMLQLGYPSIEEENEVLRRLQGHHPIADLQAVTDSTYVLELQRVVTEVFVEDSVRDFCGVTASRVIGELLHRVDVGA